MEEEEEENGDYNQFIGGQMYEPCKFDPDAYEEDKA